MLKLVNFAMHHVDAAYPANSRLEINETLKFNRKKYSKEIHTQYEGTKYIYCCKHMMAFPLAYMTTSIYGSSFALLRPPPPFLLRAYLRQLASASSTSVSVTLWVFMTASTK